MAENSPDRGCVSLASMGGRHRLPQKRSPILASILQSLAATKIADALHFQDYFGAPQLVDIHNIELRPAAPGEKRPLAKKWVRLAALHHRSVFLEDRLPGFSSWGGFNVLIQQRQAAETEALTYRDPARGMFDRVAKKHVGAGQIGGYCRRRSHQTSRFERRDSV